MAKSIKTHCFSESCLWRPNPNAPNDENAIEFKYFEEQGGTDKTTSNQSSLSGTVPVGSDVAQQLSSMIGAGAAPSIVELVHKIHRLVSEH